MIISYLDNSFMAYTCTNTGTVHCKLLGQCVVCYLLGELISDQLHLAKSSSPNDFNQIKIIGLHPPLPDLRGHIRICRGMLVAGVRAFLPGAQCTLYLHLLTKASMFFIFLMAGWSQSETRACTASSKQSTLTMDLKRCHRDMKPLVFWTELSTHRLSWILSSSFRNLSFRSLSSGLACLLIFSHSFTVS